MKNLFTPILTLLTTVAFAQTKTLQVIGSAGNTASNANAQLTWTIGEPISNTGKSTNNALTQGFHQGGLVITAVDEIEKMDVSIQPNPTSDYALIELSDLSPDNASYTLLDVAGKVIEQRKIENKQASISFQGLASATYFIQVTNNQKTKTFKIIKN